MTHATALSPAVIRAESSADFLALLPALTGYTVKNSLLVVLFSGNRSFGALRFDLPPHDNPRAGNELATAIATALRQLVRVDGVAFAIVTDQNSADLQCTDLSSINQHSISGCSSEHDGLPWRHLARRLERRIARTGLVLRDSCCVAADGWVSYLTPPPGGAMRPLSEIEQSLAGLEASLITDEPIVGLEQMGELPKPDVERAAAVRHILDESRSRPKASSFIGPRFSALITRPGALATAKDCARLANAAASLSGWLRLACAALESSVGDVSPLGQRDNEHAGLFNEAIDVADCLDRGGVLEDQFRATQAFGPMEHALVSFARVQPDRDRCHRAIMLLSEITANLPRAHQVGLRCLIAWLWWWTGLASVAARHVQDALQIDPESGIATMMERVIDHGMIPPWVHAGPPQPAEAGAS
jgi:hypothetical protein